MKKFKLLNREDYIKEANEFKPAITQYLLGILKSIFGDNFSFKSFNSARNDVTLMRNSLNKNEKNNNLNCSLELRTERKKKPNYQTVLKSNRYDSCPNTLKNENNKKETSNNDDNKNNKQVKYNKINKNNKRQININIIEANDTKINNASESKLHKLKKVIKSPNE